MLNNSTRQPRGLVYLNGLRVAWIDIEVNINGYYQADSFRVVIPTKGQPSEMTRAWLAAQNPLVVEIYAGFPADVNNFDKSDPNMSLLITGSVDELPHKLVAENAALIGRDFSSVMIETKIFVDDHLNRTASDIMLALAKKYSLKPVVTRTTTKLGRLYELSYTKLTKSCSEWDFACFLAREESFQVYVKGYELHFEPKPDAKLAPIYPVEWKDEDSNGLKQFPARELTCIKNLTLAKDIIVRVWCVNTKTGKRIIKSAQAQHTRDKVLNKGKQYIGKPQIIYEHHQGSMTPEELQAEANKMLREISHHQVKILIDGMPADNVLSPRHVIRLSGTGAYDQDYYADSIIRRLNMHDGYVMDIVAKNHDVNTQVVL